MTDAEFTAAARRHADTIYRVAYSWLRDSQDAKDISQNVLIKLFRCKTEFESDEHLKSWLIRVTINECRTLFRAPWRKHEDIDDYAQSLGIEDTRLELFDAVMRMDKKYRVPLMLMYYDGYSTREIAEMLHIPQNTVSTRLARAKSLLKLLLEDDSDD